jgi:hypothetical protein
MEFANLNINIDNLQEPVAQAVAQAVAQPVAQVIAQPVAQAIPNSGMNVTSGIMPEVAEMQIIQQAIHQETISPTPVVTPIAFEQDSDIEIIGEMKSAYFGGFIKILEFLSDNMGSQDIIYIEDGKLSTLKASGFIYCDLETLFGKNNFEIIDPKNAIKKLKLCRGGDLVSILNVKSENKYRVISSFNGEANDIINIFKPQLKETQSVKAPTLGEKKFSVEMELDIISKLIEAKKAYEATYYTIVLEKDTYRLVSIELTDDYKHNFTSTTKETISLKVFDPFPITKAEGIIFEVHTSADNRIFIQTIADVSITSIRYTELAAEKTAFDTLTL